MNEKIKEYQNAFNTAFISGNYNSDVAYRPQFIYNDSKNGKKVLSSIEDELLSCHEFSMSVAFITKSGITPLLQTFKELEKRNIKGRILTTDYLDFSDPDALDMLAKFSNIELRMYQTKLAGNAFHTKGYIFQKGEEYHFIIGSSNLTQNALTKNMEWNTKLVSTIDGEMLNSIMHDFDKLWNSKEYTKDYNLFINEYRIRYRDKQLYNKLVSEQMKEVGHLFEKQYDLKPNLMQTKFIENLNKMISNGIDKALLISATGTGKTYAAAFAMRELKYKKVLFVVHRNQIAKQAKRSFDKVFNYQIKSGMLTGNKREMNNDFIFATVQTLSKNEVLESFPKDYFDACIYDEAHHTSANSYKKIMDYFQPKFSLGMTATPDKRNDNEDGQNIYEIFDHNIAYEIRLQQAMEEDLLCPFHYFGITDLDIIGDRNTYLKKDIEDFRYLTCDERVKNIINSAEFYGYSGDRVKGLIFCSRIDEARDLSRKLNQYGLKTIALSGADSEEARANAIDRLTMDVENDLDNYLDYIITVDIFSEGTDIVEVNQIIMLRPTESPIVFVQQLGRGLRKSEGKEYVVVLDFIGNYTNNFMIPIALSGDRSYNKDTIRRYVSEGSRIIPGSSTIHFDEISKRRIFSSIDNAKTNDTKIIKEAYDNLKFKLGRIPYIKEFKDYGSIDITKIFLKFGSYHSFLKKYDRDYGIELDDREELIIEYFSKKIVFFKRIHELLLLKELILGNKSVTLEELLMNEYNIIVDKNVKSSVVNNLTNKFAKIEEKTRHYNCSFIEFKDGIFVIDNNFGAALNNQVFKNMCLEILEFGISQYEEKYIDRYADTNFTLYEKYTYEDVCRLLNWDQNMNAQNIGGYFYNEKYKTLPVFINYHKSEDAIAYEDRFISESQMIALSKHPRTIDSKDANHIYKRTKEDKDNRIYLFVRKNKDDKEAKEFYFLGEINAIGDPKQIYMSSTNDNAFEINYKLDTPVRSDIYDYIVNK